MKEQIQKHKALVSDCELVQSTSIKLSNTQTHVRKLQERDEKLNSALNMLETTKQDLSYKLQNNKAKEKLRVEAFLNGDEPGVDSEGQGASGADKPNRTGY